MAVSPTQEFNKTLLRLLEVDTPLRIGDYQITSPCDYFYNCFAWSLGYSNFILDPTNQNSPWYGGVDAINDVSTILNFYLQEGFETCLDGVLEEPIFQKVVLYELDGLITHASRLLPEGLWASKLGFDEDIVYLTPESFFGNDYGRKLIYLKRGRKKTDPTPLEISQWKPRWCIDEH